MSAFVEAFCCSRIKGIPKTPISKAVFKENFGIETDAHAGDWHRQVSLLAGESIDRMKLKMPELQAGAFAENIVTRNLNIKAVKVNDILTIGDHIRLQVTQIGKKCHNACIIKEKTGECIMPVEGIFARVLQGGTSHPGDPIKHYPHTANTN